MADESANLVQGQLEALTRSINELTNTIASADPGINIQGWVLTGVLSVSALLAFYSLISQRISERRRTTYDYMVRVRTAPDYMAAEVAFLDMAHSERLLSILKNDDKTSRADRDHLEKQKEQIRTFLNYLELMALAIQRHVLDEQLCKDYARSIFIRRWEMSEELVKKIQEDSPRS
jgi:hypothetical protein